MRKKIILILILKALTRMLVEKNLVYEDLKHGAIITGKKWRRNDWTRWKVTSVMLGILMIIGLSVERASYG